MTDVFPQAEEADILLLLEGTFPYVSGGVSSWVHQIVRGFPEYRFAAIFLGSRPEDYHAMKYKLPENLVHLEVHYLMNQATHPHPKPIEGRREAFEKIEALHEWFRQPSAEEALQVLHDVSLAIDDEHGIDRNNFFTVGNRGITSQKCTKNSARILLLLIIFGRFAYACPLVGACKTRKKNS